MLLTIPPLIRIYPLQRIDARYFAVAQDGVISDKALAATVTLNNRFHRTIPCTGEAVSNHFMGRYQGVNSRIQELLSSVTDSETVLIERSIGDKVYSGILQSVNKRNGLYWQGMVDSEKEALNLERSLGENLKRPLVLDTDIVCYKSRMSKFFIGTARKFKNLDVLPNPETFDTEYYSFNVDGIDVTLRKKQSGTALVWVLEKENHFLLPQVEKHLNIYAKENTKAIPPGAIICWGEPAKAFWDEGTVGSGHNNQISKIVADFLPNPNDLSPEVGFKFKLRKNGLECTVYRGRTLYERTISTKSGTKTIIGLCAHYVWYVMPKDYETFGEITGLTPNRILLETIKLQIKDKKTVEPKTLFEL